MHPPPLGINFCERDLGKVSSGTHRCNGDAFCRRPRWTPRTDRTSWADSECRIWRGVPRRVPRSVWDRSGQPEGGSGERESKARALFRERSSRRWRALSGRGVRPCPAGRASGPAAPPAPGSAVRSSLGAWDASCPPPALRAEGKKEPENPHRVLIPSSPSVLVGILAFRAVSSIQLSARLPAPAHPPRRFEAVRNGHRGSLPGLSQRSLFLLFSHPILPFNKRGGFLDLTATAFSCAESLGRKAATVLWTRAAPNLFCFVLFCLRTSNRRKSLSSPPRSFGSLFPVEGGRETRAVPRFGSFGADAPPPHFPP